jgi:hypothetical protein
MAKPASLIGDSGSSLQPQAKKPEAPAKAAEPVTWHRITGGPSSGGKAGEVGPFRRTHGDYFLKLGNEINSTEYDIKALTRAGVKMDTIDPPGWWVEAQQNAQDKVEQLRARGVRVDDAPEYVAPAPVNAPTAA